MISLRQTRVVDAVLSTIAQGYRNADFVGFNLFPMVPVDVSGGQIIEFGREDFKSYNMRRAPGGNAKRIQFGYLGKPFALLQDSVDGMLPREYIRDAQAALSIDVSKIAIYKAMRAVLLGAEIDQAAIALTAANYDAQHKIVLAGATKWSVGTGNPLFDIDTGREAIRASTGMYPNVGLMSAVAFTACKNNANITARFQYTSHDSITPEMLARLFQLDKLVIGKAITTTDANAVSDVWGNNVVLAYANLGALDAAEPSYGYTYTMRGQPNAEQPYYDNSARSWLFPVNYERVPVLSGISSGYLIQNPN
ncbi:MAG TPA: hypothetical protein VF928_09250 [Usitatibacteraceae bacterium]